VRVLRLVGLHHPAEGAPVALETHPGPGVEQRSPEPAHHRFTTVVRCLPRLATRIVRAVSPSPLGCLQLKPPPDHGGGPWQEPPCEC
jgi:hypothetical protein